MSDSRALVPYAAPPPPALVDRNGIPLRSGRDVLTREISAPTVTGIRSIVSGHPAQGLDPARLGSILRAAENGDATAYLELAEEIEEKYPHYLSVLGTRKRAVAQLPINVEAAGDSPEEEEDAQLVRDWLKRLTLQGELFDMLDAIGKGYSVTEIIWNLDETPWLPERLEWVDPRFFEFDQVTGKQLLLKGGIDGDSGLAQPLPPAKFITHFAQSKSGLPIRGGLARTVAWFYLFANFALKDWITFLEVYGLPLRVGKYANGTSEADIRKLAQAVAQIGSDAGCVIPQSMMLEFITSGGATANPEMFHTLLTYVDDLTSKATIGQTSSADAKPSGIGSGMANQHENVRGDIRDADAMGLSVTLTRDVAKPIVMFNRGQRKRYPIVRVGEPDAIDMDRGLKAIDAAVKHKVAVGVNHFRKVTGLPAPEPGEELLAAPATEKPENGDPGVIAPNGPEDPESRQKPLLNPLKTPSKVDDDDADAVAAAAAAEMVREPDALDRLVDDAIGQLGGLDDALLGGFEEMIASAASLEEVRELIAVRAGEIIDRMDDSTLVTALARSSFATRVAGLIEKPGA
ncbi:DUF935 domain-containing protein [Sphingomonas sp. AOB5]|uniref:DUF935 domain-containing protein n=1 Tax=Sphingomonas sp. AOB5 TaxID=3034017 RepID=UPI0023F9B9BA|nr:DUF935 domain-containing protein [Sphingomonas sp. AOB5]MDF7776882.1 DUF935 domain-containing protein [Sphingomonas sp. AOB5]